MSLSKKEQLEFHIKLLAGTLKGLDNPSPGDLNYVLSRLIAEFYDLQSKDELIKE